MQGRMPIRNREYLFFPSYECVDMSFQKRRHFFCHLADLFPEQVRATLIGAGSYARNFNAVEWCELAE